MANNVIINYSNAGLGTPATGEDFLSGIVYYGSAYPSGFSAASPIQEILSLSQAESLGITQGIGETLATGSTTITSSGATGAIITLQVNTTVFGLVTLGSYTVLPTDTLTTIATGLAAAVNANTLTTGFKATSNSAVVTITAPTQTGVGGNSFTFSNTFTLGATATNTSFSGGVASTIDPLFYHISEYFRANPTGHLFVYVTTGTSSSSSYSEVTTLQNFSNGKIRQIGVYEQISFNTTNVASLQAQATSLSALNKPVEIIYQADFSSVSNLTTLTDLTTLNAQNVTVTFGQDGGNNALNGGYRIWLATGKSIGTLGITLGAISSALVSQSIAWVQNFNMDLVELDTLAFANGTLLSTQSDNLINAIDAKAYVFLKKYIGISGSYFNNDYTSVSPTSSYSSVHLNRTIHKAARNVRAALLPSIASPVFFNADGTISPNSIAFFEEECNTALLAMQSTGEISAYATIINAKQNVLATKTLYVTVQVVPVGTANVISVSLGFVLSV